MLELSDVFAIDLFGYAVMSNHYHVVLQIVPDRCSSWTDEVVADKWLALFPRHATSEHAEQFSKVAKHEILSNPERILELRQRLSSLSWYMRCLNEPLARLANKEDECKGRFWEGRFKSQRLLDETAVIAAMVYVDLNPMRAGIATSVEDSHHTSIHRRSKSQPGDEIIRALNASGEALPVSCSLDEYKALLIWTAFAQQSKGDWFREEIQDTHHVSNIAQRFVVMAEALCRYNHFSRRANSPTLQR